MFCVECGAEEELVPEASLCIDCYLKKNKIAWFPDRVKITLCPTCDSFKRGERWMGHQGFEDLTGQILDQYLELSAAVEILDFKVVVVKDEGNKMLLDYELGLWLGGRKFKHVAKLELIQIFHSCDTCSRRAGTYYEAILQVRRNRTLSDGELDNIQKKVKDFVQSLSRNNRNAFISKTLDIKGGLDFYLSPSSAGRELSKTLSASMGGIVNSSSELAGRKDGEDLYRMTYLVRLYDYGPGDFISANNILYRVMHMTKQGAKVRHLVKGVTTTVPHNSIQLVGVASEVAEAVVVSQGQNEVQVMDPEDFRTVSVLLPSDMLELGETVMVFKKDETLYLVPRK